MKINEELRKGDIKNDEEKVEFKMKVSEFDIAQSHLEMPEDLDAKTIKYIEKEVRNSYEYRSYIKYLKDELDLTRCSLLPNMDSKVLPINLEFHHFPFTLYDITETIGKSIIDDLTENETASCFDIAEKVIEEHFQNNIGLVPLTETLHEMAHNNAITIPMDKVHGNYKKYVEKYRNHISPESLDKVSIMEIYNESEEAKEFNRKKLKKKIVNYDIDYDQREE
jgi:hypothetical protein